MKTGPLTIRKQFEITAGDMLVQCEADAEDRLGGVVQVRFRGGRDEDVITFEDASEVERAAEVLRSVRRELGDHRNICVSHGYYDLLVNAERDYVCPECAEDEARRQAPVLVKEAP